MHRLIPGVNPDSGVAKGQPPRAPLARERQRGAKKYIYKWAMGDKNPCYTTVCPGRQISSLCHWIQRSQRGPYLKQLKSVCFWGTSSPRPDPLPSFNLQQITMFIIFICEKFGFLHECVHALEPSCLFKMLAPNMHQKGFNQPKSFSFWGTLPQTPTEFHNSAKLNNVLTFCP